MGERKDLEPDAFDPEAYAIAQKLLHCGAKSAPPPVQNAHGKLNTRRNPHWTDAPA